MTSLDALPVMFNMQWTLIVFVRPAVMLYLAAQHVTQQETISVILVQELTS